MKNRIPFVLSLALVSASPLHASVLMLDFGQNITGSDNLTNSPYHTVTPTFTDTSWNRVQTADLSSGLVYSDNTAATGVGVSSGLSATTTISLAGTPSQNAGGINAGIYGGSNAPGKDFIFNPTASGNLGVQVTGLAAGIYQVFLHGRNTATANDHTLTSYVSAGAAGDFNYAAYDNQTLSYVSTGSSASWVAEGSTGENYSLYTVTLTAGQALNFGFSGTGDNSRGFVNLIQIVQVPEPSAALLGTLGSLLLLRRKR